LNCIFIVEDEDSLRVDLVDYMNLQGLHALGLATASELREALEGGMAPDVVILDVSLPDENGFALAEEIRAKQDCGIIMLTALGGAENRVRGFESGADIYLVKHTSLREIAAAIQSLLRRLKTAPSSDEASTEEWIFDSVSWKLTAPTGQTIRLTATENAFVGALVTNFGKPCTREALTGILSKRQTQFDNRHLDSVVSRLRRKLEEQAKLDSPIRAVYGIGYTFSGPVRMKENLSP